MKKFRVKPPIIAKYAPEWPVDQLAVIDRNILRMALYELQYNEDVPIKVAINEAVELAKIFGSDTSPRFVNGVLGAFMQDHPPAELRH
jgi:N utilization substance protein B